MPGMINLNKFNYVFLVAFAAWLKVNRIRQQHLRMS